MDIPTSFVWPPDLEDSIFELIRPHAQCGLKKRTWKAVHEQIRVHTTNTPETELYPNALYYDTYLIQLEHLLG